MTKTLTDEERREITLAQLADRECPRCGNELTGEPAFLKCWQCGALWRIPEERRPMRVVFGPCESCGKADHADAHMCCALCTHSPVSADEYIEAERAKEQPETRPMPVEQLSELLRCAEHWPAFAVNCEACAAVLRELDRRAREKADLDARAAWSFETAQPPLAEKPRLTVCPKCNGQLGDVTTDHGGHGLMCIICGTLVESPTTPSGLAANVQPRRPGPRAREAMRGVCRADLEAEIRYREWEDSRNAREGPPGKIESLPDPPIPETPIEAAPVAAGAQEYACVECGTSIADCWGRPQRVCCKRCMHPGGFEALRVWVARSRPPVPDWDEVLVRGSD